ncbi:MAG: hypothetical protein OEU51_07510 [Gammaproteobacteria bacterium]|nr:hypothetical protein [Gammaproteobacteria bacterium]
MTRRKVFCAGLGKTGTTSLKEALRMLGYRTIRLPLDWQGITDFDAALPGVSAAMYKELDKAFPHSRFILTVRDVEGWLKSIERDMGRKQDVRRDREEERERLLEMLYGAAAFEPERFRQAFHNHETAVRDYFEDRAGDLLVLDVTKTSGWDELCSFLEEPVPDEPFPFVNKASELDELLVRLLHVTRDIDTVAEISKYSTAYLESLSTKKNVENYDMQRPVSLKDDRRINKVLKRSSKYFGGPAKAAKKLNLPETVFKEAIRRQKRHARSKHSNRHTFARLRSLLGRR